jgi:hypothetical protein
MSAETDELASTASSEEHHHQQPTQPHLAKQDATTVDPTKLTALTPEVVCFCRRKNRDFKHMYYICDAFCFGSGLQLPV